MTKDEPRIPPLPDGWTPQSRVGRCVAVGRLATLAGGIWTLGRDCTVQIEPFQGGWLVLRYAIDEARESAKAPTHGAWLPDPNAREIARRILGGRS